jgi:hypothetical protein
MPSGKQIARIRIVFIQFNGLPKEKFKTVPLPPGHGRDLKIGPMTQEHRRGIAEIRSKTH